MKREGIENLQRKANQIRKLVVEMIGRLGVGHVGGSLSLAEVLSVLYFEIMNLRPEDPGWRERDRFILSKGHGGPALYAALALRGYFERDELFTLNRPETRLPSHCDMILTRGVDMTAGSLGQGFSAAVGMALAAFMDSNPCKIYVVIGDGESQEGQIWEAAMLAGHRKLSNLIGFTDYNRMQIDGYIEDINNLEPLEKKWEAFGWDVQSVDGHDIEEIFGAVKAAQRVKDRPAMIILRTIKGKGAYFAEGKPGSHNMSVSEEMWRKALIDLTAAGGCK